MNINSDFIIDSGKRWNIRCGKTELTVCFDKDFGIALADFKNHCSERTVSYFEEDNIINPIEEKTVYTFENACAEEQLLAGKRIMALSVRYSSDLFAYEFSLKAFPNTSVVRYGFRQVYLRRKQCKYVL